jgi:hypothetical protein
MSQRTLSSARLTLGGERSSEVRDRLRIRHLGLDDDSGASTMVVCTSPRLGSSGWRKFFGRYGLATILIGGFVGLVRPGRVAPCWVSRYPTGSFAAVALVGPSRFRMP